MTTYTKAVRKAHHDTVKYLERPSAKGGEFENPLGGVFNRVIELCPRQQQNNLKTMLA